MERVEVDGKIRAISSGEMVDVAIGNRRPLAVMMSNDKESLPQYGINRAGVVYEVPVEGEMNRYMALIEDYDGLERIGSVRSARTCYTYFAREYDAIFAHYGQSTFAKKYLNNVDNINGGGHRQRGLLPGPATGKRPTTPTPADRACSSPSRSWGIPRYLTRPTRATISLRETG